MIISKSYLNLRVINFSLTKNEDLVEGHREKMLPILQMLSENISTYFYINY